MNQATRIYLTQPMTYGQLKAKLKVLSAKVGAQLIIQKEPNSKVTSQMTLKFKDGSHVDFYDYKATRLYSDTMPRVVNFRKSEYRYHVQGSNDFISNEMMIQGGL